LTCHAGIAPKASATDLSPDALAQDELQAPGAVRPTPVSLLHRRKRQQRRLRYRVPCKVLRIQGLRSPFSSRSHSGGLDAIAGWLSACTPRWAKR
jgi:hypothetical protein